MRRALLSLPLCALLFAAAGCATLWTSKIQYAGVDRMLAGGDFSAALTQIEQNTSRYPAKDDVLRLLDTGLLQHYAGQYDASNRSLEAAERAMEKARVKSVSRAAASLLINDNILEYAGEDYEAVYLHVFRALNYLALEQFDPAFVEIRQVDEALKSIEDRNWKLAQAYEKASALDESFRPGKNSFQDSALARWLSLLIYRTEGLPDDARIDLEKMARARSIQPSLYNFSAPDLSDALSPAPSGTVRVPLLAMTGQSPEKRADTLWIHTQHDLIFIALSQEARYGGQQLAGANTIPWPGMEPGYTFKFQLPRMELRGSQVNSVRITVDGVPKQRLDLVERLENSAEATFDAARPLIYLKTISRVVTKGLAAAETQRAAEKKWGEFEGLLTGLLAGFGISATENADLRICRFFPAEARIGELTLTPGLHRIGFEYLSAGGTLLFRDERTVQVRPGDVNLVESFYLN